MTAIAKIETILVRLPTRRTHKWTGLTEPIGQYLLVKMTGSNGTVGWGEAPALKDWGGEFGRYFGESTAIVDLIIQRYLAPAVAGLGVARPAELHRRMDAAVKGYPYAKAAIDFAYYDLTGKALGLPVHVLLGGLLRENVAVTHSIGLLEIDEAVSEVRKVAQDGIRTIKIKIGVDPARDVAIVKAIREAVGPQIKLCVDANEGYKTPGQAIQTIREMESVGLIYVERRDPDRRTEGRADRLDLHDQAGRPLQGDAGLRSVRGRRHHLQRQRLGGNRNRQSRQCAPGRGRACGDALQRHSGFDGGGAPERPHRRHLLRRRFPRRAHAIRRWRDPRPDGARHGHRRQ
jgi:hypothetical protein